ncbi:MAG: VOC family protein [Jatrophihabitans sp.]
MATRSTAFAPGTPCWVDLLTSDPAKAKAFYTELFGWTAVDAGPEFGNYVNFSSDGHKVAGLVANSPESGTPDFWNTYISTNDVDATVAAAVEAGAQVLVPAMAVGELGSMVVLLDPVGAAIGAWQPATHTGFEKYNEPGSVTWDEHHSKDFASSVAFYTKVFGWTVEKTSDTDDFRYYSGQIDGETVAGMMDSHAVLPAEVPSHWVVYFSVSSVDDTLAKVTELGGTVIRPAEDTPFGRVADASDPTGAAFKLHSAPTG